MCPHRKRDVDAPCSQCAGSTPRRVPSMRDYKLESRWRQARPRRSKMRLEHHRLQQIRDAFVAAAGWRRAA